MRFVYAFAQQDIFRPQLRALLRASVYGKLNIMFPMVATINEFREAKAILLEEKENLKNEGHDISDDIELRNHGRDTCNSSIS